MLPSVNFEERAIFHGRRVGGSAGEPGSSAMTLMRLGVIVMKSCVSKRCYHREVRLRYFARENDTMAPVQLQLARSTAFM